MSPGRVLALDYGTKYVGLACSDELRILVRPLPSIPNSGRRDLVKRLRETIREHCIAEIVVGIPWHMDGSTNESVSRVESFIEMLHEELKLPLQRIDERLTTADANEIWKGMGRRQQRKYRTVDSLAAALILERFLGEP